MLFKTHSLFGLDIGSSYIKAVQLKKLKKAGYELEVFEIMPIAPGIVDDGAVINKEKLSEALKILIKKANIKSSYAAVSVSGHSSVIIKIIAMQDISEEEMAKSIKFEAEQYVPFGIDDVNLDFQILGKRKDDNQVDVLLVAVKKVLIDDYLKVLESADVTATIIDVTAFALTNMYEFTYGSEKTEGEEKIIAIFDVGAGNINMTVIKRNNPVFVRDSAVGARIITESLEKAFQIDYDTAEGILKNGALPAGMVADEVSNVLMNAAEEVMSDIIGSLDYYMSSYNEHIDKVVVCGGGSLLGQFAEILAERTGIEIVMADPFKNISIPETFDKEFLKTMGPIGAVALGLALREVGDK
jgi:type IV pilus assembly protein PilM